MGLLFETLRPDFNIHLREDYHHNKSFTFFLPVLLGAPVPDRAVVRHILQPKLATCLHILEPIFEFAFAVWILKSPIFTLIFEGSHFVLDVTVPIKTCRLFGWKIELVWILYLVATSY